MTGRTNGNTKRFLDAIRAQDVVVIRSIIHQEKLCTKVWAFPAVMKNIVQCVNFIRARRLNHWQFKAFIEYRYCDYPDVVYFSAVCWLRRAATL